jgi:hypothetical protein
MKSKEKTILSDQVKLTKLAALKAADKKDFTSCIADMKKYAHLGDEDALEVAKAVKRKYMPSVLLELGLEGDELAKEDNDDTGFAQRYKNEPEEKEENFEVLKDDDEDSDFDEDFEDDDQTTEDLNEDGSEEEEEDEGIAMIQVSVPANRLKEVEKALNDVLKGEKMDIEPISEKSEMSEDLDEDLDEEEDIEDDLIHSEGKQVENMNKEKLATRKAERRAIIAEIEEVKPVDIGLGHDTETSGNPAKKTPFKYDGQNQNMKTEEISLTTKKFEGGGKSDMGEGYPEYKKQKVPTTNPELLELKKEIESIQFSEKPSNAADYEVDFDMFEVPSDGSGRAEHEFEQPIMSEHEMTFKSTPGSAVGRMASVLGDLDVEKAEEVLAGLLVEAGVETDDISKMTYAEGIELYHAIRTAGSFNETHGTQGVDEHPEITGDPYKGKGAKAAEEKIIIETADKEEDEKDSSMIKRDKKDDMEKEATVYKARLKTAFACSYKLLEANCLEDSDQAEEYAETLMKDNLTATAMIRQTTLWLKSAQAIKSEKIAKANKNDKSTVKTASTFGLSINPSINTVGYTDTSGVLDLAEALKGKFTGSRTETEEEN